ncbi:MmpS family transport accessory protein [Mycolicibacterium mengxianglii]|uniref:MmpS family transport accessory protein n=1 Tax=Mycolicibacterium mengxianglii TaxID=2736649 RepID=UPI0018D037C3|nr:MmpS family transport accessory protein [Mycolicibacterium mengxianglii]
MLKRVWLPLALVVVLVLGGFTVSRLRGIFGSEELPTYAGSTPDDSSNSDPKRVVYEVFGDAGAIADINYLDTEGEPVQINDVSLPWSVELETTAPSMAANVVAQGDSDFIGCRISSDGEVHDERSSSAVSAYVYCMAKSA